MAFMLYSIDEAIDCKYVVTKALKGQAKIGTLIHVMDAREKEGDQAVSQGHRAYLCFILSAYSCCASCCYLDYLFGLHKGYLRHRPWCRIFDHCLFGRCYASQQAERKCQAQALQ